LEQVAERRLLWIEDDLDRLRVRAVVAVRRVRDVAAAVADPRRDHAWLLAEEVLHPPEAPAGKDGRLGRTAHAVNVASGVWSRRLPRRRGASSSPASSSHRRAR